MPPYPQTFHGEKSLQFEASVYKKVLVTYSSRAPCIFTDLFHWFLSLLGFRFPGLGTTRTFFPLLGHPLAYKYTVISTISKKIKPLLE